MDPIGFGFEHFDGGGRFRLTENGLPIDASGAINQADVEGPFDGVVELADRLAGSAQVRGCIARQWFRYAYGRAETDDDACTLDALDAALSGSGGRIRDLLVALTQTDAFLNRPAGDGGSP
jgi:hypothetical protein